MSNTTTRTGQAAAAAVMILALAACGTMPTNPPDAKAPTKPTVPADSANAPAPTSTTPSLTPPTYPTGKAGIPRGPLPNPARVNGQDPDAVVVAALTVMYAMDTAIDTTPHDATVRAAPYLTPAYADQLKDHQPAMAPGAQWQTWTAHHAYTTATITPAEDPGRPSDTPTTAYRQYTITTTAHGDDGYTDPAGPTGTAFVELTRTDGGPWRVATVQVR
ncbi:MAG: hypothetical protein JO362_22245 [Streptomycetaceae bacterium]|nr:hypothetical protein [Streptomycetaceae bacterium]